MQSEHRAYEKACKIEAVRLVQTSGKSISQVARDLGISDSNLCRWCRDHAERGEQAFVGSGHQTAQEEEIRHLKRELDRVRQERDILKKAVAIFSHP
jgi:transposase